MELLDFYTLVKNTKVSQKELSMMIGITDRNIRSMKKNDFDRYSLLMDGLKFKKATGQLDAKIIKEDDKYWLIYRNEKIIGADNIDEFELNDREKQNLKWYNETIVPNSLATKSVFL